MHEISLSGPSKSLNSFQVVFVILTWVIISRLKKFEDDEDEESLSNMDTQCEVKPDSQLNCGTGSNSEYLVSMESGTETEFSFYFCSLHFYIFKHFCLCGCLFLRAERGACVLAGKHEERWHPGVDDALFESSRPDVSGRVAFRTRWSGFGYIQLLEKTQRWAAQSSAQGLQQPAHKGTREMH